MKAMERKINRKSQVRKVVLESGQEQLAEHVRLLHKELRWATGHLAAIYDIIKPADAPKLVDPNQIKLFQDDTTRI
jgi:hypothetical protein